MPEVFKENVTLQHDIPLILSCAGLLHDLGNPPFGHFGEVIIGEWFTKQLNKDDFRFKGTPIKDLFNDQMKKDLCHFEGNAQAFRLLSKARLNSNGHNPNLTYAVINTLIKYPANSSEINSDSEDIRIHKAGYFLSEQPLFEEVRSETGVFDVAQKDSHARYPLTYLLEAADDIAYATSDLEDALKKRMFTIHEFTKYVTDSLEKLPQGNKKDKSVELFSDLKPNWQAFPTKIQKRS